MCAKMRQQWNIPANFGCMSPEVRCLVGEGYETQCRSGVFVLTFNKARLSPKLGITVVDS